MGGESGDCKGAGLVMPVIHRNRCEGKSDCMRVCPYHVFDMGKLSPEQRSELTFLGRLKAWAHGYRQAFVANGGLCENCGLCVSACPEHAITLKSTRTGPA